MKKSIFSRAKLAGLLVLFVIGFVFAGCKQPVNQDTTSGSDPKKTTEQSDEPQSNPSTPIALTASDALVGKWIDAYESVYEITVSDFKNYGEGYSSYEGNELKVLYTNDAKTEGYIYIKYTQAYESVDTEPTGEDKDTWTYSPANPDWGTSDSWYRYSSTAPDVGKWYAIAFKDLTANAVKVSGAAGTKTSTETLEEAVAEFTVDKGYFSFYSDCAKQ